MSTATQVTDFSDIYTDLLNRMREPTGVTDIENQAKKACNTALHDMHIGPSERVPWAERQATLRTQPIYTTGTVSMTKGSQSITGASTLWNTNNDFGVANVRVGGKMVLPDGSNVYEVSAVASDTGATLAQPLVSDSISGESYRYFEDEYDLADDFGRPIDQRRFNDGAGPIELVGRNEFRRKFPQNHLTGTPVVATIVDRAPSGSTTPRRRIVFHQAPESAVLIPYSYVTTHLATTDAGVGQAQMVNDTDEPIVPLRYRHVIVLHALYNWYRDKRDDTRSKETKDEYTDMMIRLMSDFEIGQSRPQLQPKTGAYRRRAAKPWSGGSARRYQTGNEFDTLRTR